MNVVFIIIMLLFAVIPTATVALAVTLFILSSKHKISSAYSAEFTWHHLKSIRQFECSRKEIERILDKKR